VVLASEDVSVIPIAPVLEPPPIEGVRRRFVDARGVRFHVTESGPLTPEAIVVLALHGWPQHHYEYRDLLGDPPGGLRIIAPDLPGYGWSSAPTHHWFKEQVASDVLALMDALGLGRPVVLVGHDWGGYIANLMVLREPERFGAYLALNIPHPWNNSRTALPHLLRLLAYQPVIAAFGVPLMQRTGLVYKAIRGSLVDRSSISREEVTWFSERFRDPVCARSGTDTYRTFLLRELPRAASRPEHRRSKVPTLALFGMQDNALHYSLAAAETAKADEYRLELIPGCGHFIVDERPALIRERVISLASQVRNASAHAAYTSTQED
jgi:pimeloyl-ACP methyl ester carboxylesterase